MTVQTQKKKPDIQSLAQHPMFAALKAVKKMSEAELDRLCKKMEREREAEREAEQRILNQQRYEQSGVPKKFFPHSIDTYKARDAFQKSTKQTVSAYIANADNRMLLLCGNNGTGKSHLGCAVIRECGGIYVSSFKLCVEYESGADFKSKRTKLEVLDFYVKQKMLVIDEVGRFTDEKTEKTIIPAIINMRYEDNLPTVVISNLSKEELVAYFGKATYDRMTETCTSVEFHGKSMREELRGRQRN
ncbi:MAG: ATP-binding protein [Treponema sp.]